MSAPQRIVAVVVAAIVMVVVVVVWINLAAGDGQATASIDPSESASRSAAPTPSSTGDPASAEPSAQASAPSEEEALAILSEIEQQVEAIRGLDAADVGPPDLITRAQLAVELREIFDAEYPPEERAQDNEALRALGLIGPNDDVAELQLELLGEGVLGFYDDIDKRMVVVTDVGLDAVAKVTYAHEYTHALQDATFGLDTLETDAEGQDDRGLARTALIEGDAQVTMISWLLAHLTRAEQIQLTEMPVPDTSGIPDWMVSQIEFPYTDGHFWASQLAGGDPFTPSFTEIDAAYLDPPTSTEQIIDINAWLAREEPMQVSTPDLAGALGEGWAEVDETPVGEATIAIILEHFGVEATIAGLAADGWGGDRVVIASGPDDAFAVIWKLAWDERTDAGEFTDGYEAVVTELPFPASVRALADGTVLVVHGSSQEIHDAAVGIGGG